jgi:hypothetical protein
MSNKPAEGHKRDGHVSRKRLVSDRRVCGHKTGDLVAMDGAEAEDMKMLY